MTGEIYLEDDEPDIVRNMVTYLYTTKYDDHRFENIGEAATGTNRNKTEKKSSVGTLENLYSPNSLTTNAKMYIIADKNEIEALKKLASEKYKDVVPSCWNSVAFIESARLIYENTVETDRVLKEVIAQIAADNIKTLLGMGEFIELLNCFGDLAIGVLKRVVPH
jgi:hypothetical protein